MATTTRGKLLATALNLTEGDRNQTYGEPWQNLTDIAGLWTAYLIGKYRGAVLDENSVELVAEDVAHLNVLQKMARSFQPGYHADTYIDEACYSAIAGECRLIEESLME